MVPMLLLNISDIHFREPHCLTPETDPDRPYRTLMMRDARDRTARLGPAGAMLISGDVAFKGHPREYEVAKRWIEELAEACGCPLERIFVIPGNHDVDRGLIGRSAAVRNSHSAITNAGDRREVEFRSQLADLDTARALMKPLEAYNEFASAFSCQVYLPDHLAWKQDIPLSKGVHLRLHGLTSVLLSGVGGRDDVRGTLYVSPLQTVFDPADDVVNLAMCHHPVDWLFDGDDVDEKMANRTAVHIFGHKHRQRIFKDDGYVRFAAGAVNPDRAEAGWRPAYNLIQVDVTGEGEHRMLDVSAHLLQLQDNPERYVPVLTGRGETVHRHSIPIPGRPRPTSTPTGPSLDSADGRAFPFETEAETDIEVAMSDQGTRNLVFRFWNLSVSQRREIALALGIMTRADLALPEPERYGRALLKAGELGLLDRVADEVARRERNT